MKRTGHFLLPLGLVLFSIGCRSGEKPPIPPLPSGLPSETAQSGATGGASIVDLADLERLLQSDQIAMMHLSSGDDTQLEYRDGSLCTLRTREQGNRLVLDYQYGANSRWKTVRMDPQTFQQFLIRVLSRFNPPEGMHMTMTVGGQTVELGSSPSRASDEQ
jgi:hypothetical protein